MASAAAALPAATLVDLLRRRAGEQPETCGHAFEDDGGETAQLTYAELDRRARAIAVELVARGARGGRVLLVFPPGLDYVAALFGCFYAGAAAVPVYPPRSERENARFLVILRDAQAAAVLTTSWIAGLVADEPELRGGAAWIASDALALEAADAWRDPVARPETLALVQYTSGSTAAPKGVLLSHANLLHNLGLIHAAFGHDERSRGVIWLPPYHDMGLIGGLLQPLYGAFPVLLLSPVTFLQTPLRWLQAISRFRASTSGGPNFAYDLCARRISDEQRASLDLSCWRVAFNGAEPIRAASLAAFARAFEPCGFRRSAFYPCYGLAEGTLIVTGGACAAEPRVASFDGAALERHHAQPAAPAAVGARTLVGSGRALGGQRLLIADPQTGAVLPAGRVGEICVSGPSVTVGYWRQPELSAAACQARLPGAGEDAFLRTGDLGFLGHDGELFVTGRLKDLIIVRGRNHYPQDLEATAERAHAALRPGCGAAFALEVAGEERLALIYEVQRDKRTTDVEEVARAVRQRLAEEHELQLDALVLLKPGAVPKTSSGKIQRHACRQGFLDGSLPALAIWRASAAAADLTPDDDAPLDGADDVLRFLRAQVAGRARVPLDAVDAARALGQQALDSLQAVELVQALETRLGVTLSLRELLEAPSLRGLAEELWSRRARPSPAEAGPLAGSGGRTLSPGQRALWFLHQLDPRSTAYNVAVAVRLHGPLDRAALRQAWGALVARHAVLRSTFALEDGAPVVVPQPPGAACFEEHDAAGWSEADLRARLLAEARRPFDLALGPLARVALFASSRDAHALALTLHHAVTDFWSLGLLLQELDVLYRVARGEALAPLPAPVLEYADYARWQDDLVAGPAGERLLAYWREQLRGELSSLALLADRPRPVLQTYVGASQPFQVDSGLLARLRALGRTHATTLVATLVAAFQVLLARFARQHDVIVGVPASGRSRACLARVPGYFVNPLALRADLAPDPSFESFLDRVRETVLGGFEHQDYPFAALVEKLHPQRDPSRSPIFQAMLAVQSAPAFAGQSLGALALAEAGARLQWAGLTLETLPLEQHIAQFDLSLTLAEVGDSLRGSLDANVDLFEPATRERLARSFMTLLRGLADAPQTRLSALPLLDENERREILSDWGAGEVEGPAAGGVQALVAAQAERTPQATAVICAQRRLSYAELLHRARQVAAALRALGVGRESVVGIALESSVDVVVAILGVLEAGAAFLPLDMSFPEGRLAFLARDARLRALVTLEHLRARLPSGVPHLSLDGEAERLAALPAEASAETPSPEALACVLYTSGSTGEPKGALLTRRGVLNLVTSFVASYAVGADDRILPLTSIASASFVGEVLPLLCAGGAVVLPEREQTLDVALLQALASTHGVTIVSTVPALLATVGALGLPSLRLALVGGEALTPADLGVWPDHVELVNGYGLTETTVCSTYQRVGPRERAAGGAIGIGRPIRGTRVRLLDDGQHLVPAGVLGEIHVGGAGLARGYLGRPDLTAERFVPDPFQPGERLYRTGDLGAWSADGRLDFHGRADRQVKVRGFRVDLQEIEAALGRVPGVRECAVMAREDVPGERRLVGYVVAEGAAPATGALLLSLRATLPEYMLPAALQTLAVLPRTPSGKVDLRRLPPPDSARPELAAAYAAPRSELQRRLASVWQELLRVERVGLHDSFFDLGGHSLLLAKLQSLLRERLGREVSLVDLMRHPSVDALARHLSPDEEPEPSVATLEAPLSPADGSRDIAVIAVAGRFPGARDVDELWSNLTRGVESITFFSDDELRAAGVAERLLGDPNYVKAKGVMGGVEEFDAPFFGLSPREVELMDPQHRVLLECAHEALERAGYDPRRYAGRVGVYAGASMNTYLLTQLLPGMELVASLETLQASLGNDKDPLTARISYKLDLRGPSITIQSASSTSLVAVHVACQALLAGECEMALAGGVSIHLPETSGYMFHEGGTTSRDGHCRAFDARADGFVPGSGAGLVVLKRLADAQRDGDTLLALIKGTACNNDGAHKLSFMAPSVEGQLELYARAHAAAGTTPDSLSYVECHGTGTALGDPIEFEALSLAFRAHTERRGFCALGSLKTNLGHLDTAAGVCGLIKTVLALQHRTLPPTLHFEQPNPQIDFARSPFFVNTELRPWVSDGAPRRAGVTSLGMGGTNAHVILEQAPEPQPTSPSRPWQVLTLSARSEPALETLTHGLAARLAARPELDLADVAYTLHVGRQRFEKRATWVCRDRADALAALRDPARRAGACEEPREITLVFLFSGQGSQHLGMARGLAAHEPVFRAELRRCAEALEPRLGFDLRALVDAPGAAFTSADDERLRQTAVAQPALFAVEYALAKLWMSWGLRPRAMLGHSLGEYVAACLAGVMTLDDALAIVAARGRLMQSLPRGAMLAVPLGEAELLPLLGARLDLAAVNLPGASVVSGPEDALAGLERALAGRGLDCRRLPTSHAFHSRLMDDAVPAFTDVVRGFELHAPRMAYVSNLSGTWVRAAEARDPAYWARHMRAAVRFSDGLGELLRDPAAIVLEVGPGQALTGFARRHPARQPGHTVLASLPHARDEGAPHAHLLGTLGRLWLAGAEVDWPAFHAHERRRRVVLDSYPFERRRYWVEPAPRSDAPRAAGARRPPHEWLHAPVWQQSHAPVPLRAALAAGAPFVIFLDALGVGAALAQRLRGEGLAVTTVAPGQALRRLADDAYAVDCCDEAGCEALLQTLAPPRTLVHCAALTATADDGTDDALAGVMGLIALAKALAARPGDGPRRLWLLSDGVHDVTGDESPQPAKAALLGALRSLAWDVPQLECHALDVRLVGDDPTSVVEGVLRELASAAPARVAALRGRARFVQQFAALACDEARLAPGPLREGGVYLISGGLGGLGLEIALHLAQRVRAKLALVGRGALPAREHWPALARDGASDDRVSERLRRLLALEAAGASVLVLRADVASASDVRRLRDELRARFGRVDGIIHAAGIAASGVLAAKTRAQVAAVLAPKLLGARLLSEAFADDAPDFVALFSSLTALEGQVGQVEYAAANAALDGLAAQGFARGQRIVSIAWDAWRDVGMAATVELPEELRAWQTARLATAIRPEEGRQAFEWALRLGLPHVVVSTEDLAPRLAGRRALPEPEPAASQARHPRPDLPNAYAPPADAREQAIARIWQELLGLERVGVHDNFFELGGNSLTALRVAARLKSELGVSVSDVGLFRAPTVSSLARLLAGASADGAAPVEPVVDRSRERGAQRRALTARRKSALAKE